MRLLLSLCLLSLVVPVAGAAEATSKRPNIVLILTDDQRFDTLGCLGHPVLKTPHLDALANRGTIFRNSFVTTSICAISRACLITGQYASRHGIQNFAKPLTAEQLASSFPVRLRQAGYRTGLVGKWGLGGQLPKDSWDYFTGYSGQGQYFKPGEKGTGEHLTDTQRDEALQFLAGCNADQPFLLQVYTKAAHCQDGDAWQYQPAPRYKTLYEDVTYPRPVTATETDFQAQPLFLQTSEAHNRWKLRFTEELFQPTVRDYFRLVQGIDDLAGALTARLKEQGLAENTVFIFTSDNGHYLGEHGLAGKWFMHEESIRVPLFISDPRVATGARGQNRQEFALTIDIAPTIFDLAGVAPSPGLQGRSLAPIVRGEQPANWRPEYYYEHRFVHPHIAQTEGIRTARWKYARYISETPVYEELFDLAADPYERKNLANQPESTAVLAELRQKTDAAYAEIK